MQDQPLAVQLLGQRVVLWRDGQGSAHAWPDRCPHRGAQLSLGRVLRTDDCGHRLECPYHGWQFDARGQCVRVPAVHSFEPPSSHALQPYAAHEAYGLVWVNLQPAQAAAHAVPHFAAEHDPALRKVLCGPYDVATSAPRIVENFLDMAHFGFVHEGWLGVREQPEVADYVVERAAHGVRASQCKAWQPQSNVHSTAPAEVTYDYEVLAPYTAALSKVPDAHSVAVQGFRESIALFIGPMEPTRSRVWFRLAMLDWHSSDEHLQAFQHTIFTQDQPVLESQQPQLLPLNLAHEVHCAADKLSSAYRRYLREQHITFGVQP
nr:aromatic ring-hydroxylating dioxygenase subunit alpha [Curvibacter sp. CHRR-16]